MMKWFRYLLCFLAGAALIHVVPHALNGFTPRNLLGILVSLVICCLLLWVARFRVRDALAVAFLLLGMAAVMLFGHTQSGRHAGVVHAGIAIEHSRRP